MSLQRAQRSAGPAREANAEPYGGRKRIEHQANREHGPATPVLGWLPMAPVYSGDSMVTRGESAHRRGDRLALGERRDSSAH
jgi:hypothetical protein